MRKRLFLFAAAICFALFAFATPAFAEDPVVAKIGNDEYTTLQDAITAACNDITSNDVTITLQSDLELTEGLQFISPVYLYCPYNFQPSQQVLIV